MISLCLLEQLRHADVKFGLFVHDDSPHSVYLQQSPPVAVLMFTSCMLQQNDKLLRSVIGVHSIDSPCSQQADQYTPAVLD